MAKISLIKSGKIILADPSKTLMANLIDVGIPVASSCGGEGVCAKCKIQILNGNENLNPENETEKFLKQTNDIKGNYRISCQVYLSGDLTIDASYW